MNLNNEELIESLRTYEKMRDHYIDNCFFGWHSLPLSRRFHGIGEVLGLVITMVIHIPVEVGALLLSGGIFTVSEYWMRRITRRQPDRWRSDLIDRKISDEEEHLLISVFRALCCGDADRMKEELTRLQAHQVLGPTRVVKDLQWFGPRLLSYLGKCADRNSNHYAYREEAAAQ